ncbi:hypothetical protein EXIGLDRAFT_723487 [Exidia glandulosa HHB12029]|uniref:Fungal-type protein kinase domain-containing protein n=1 Tax=Exidia glandulosa HHB12029 TaxID=1314781 RepID=A0A165ETF3_EXIGL|nr:hypothetical protein EXIGLDRAFT_723487 [Exidia glandulosa HHB12029]
MAAKPPGRMTWVGFEIGGDSDALDSVCKEPCVGVVKISYQNNEDRWKEGELLDTVHADGWLPGVVRHVYWGRDVKADVGDMTVSDTNPDRVDGVKETLQLRSVGDPLSQCTTPLQMLKVAYDATETHLQLLKRKIIHRDFSWYNILCNPWHDQRTLDDKKPLAGIPCIDYILTGDTTKEPCCLIADFDHAGRYPDIYKPGYEGSCQKIATPMFCAIETSTDTPLVRKVDAYMLETLTTKFRDVEALAVFQQAFPEGDAGFVEMFEKVVELEQKRARLMTRPENEALRFTDPATVVHEPWYDVQSIFWSILWFFVRALPEGREPRDVMDGDFSTFANTLLTHKIGKEKNRTDDFFYWDGPRSYLHPDLVHFADLIRDLALYLSVPWHMYKNHPEFKLPDDHAHTAVRRLLLAEIYTLNQPKNPLNVTLDPTQPRIIHTIYNHLTIGLPVLWRAPKRKAELAELDERDADAKRHRVQGDDKLGVALVASEPTTAVGKAVLGHRCYERGCLPQSAGARAEKLRDDRYLFFGVGVRKPLPP